MTEGPAKILMWYGVRRRSTRSAPASLCGRRSSREHQRRKPSGLYDALDACGEDDAASFRTSGEDRVVLTVDRTSTAKGADRLRIGEDVHDVAVGNDVRFSFFADFAGCFRTLHVAIGDEVVVGDRFGADKPA